MEKNKILPFLMGILLVLPLGVSSVSAWKINEIQSHCDLFDCYTDLELTGNIPQKYIGETYNLGKIGTENKNIANKIENSKIVLHSGYIEDMNIYIVDKNTIRIYGKIKPTTKNKWGAVLLGNTDFENSTWWNSSCNYRVNITIDHTKIDEDLTDFPIMVNMTQSRWNTTHTNGTDNIFVYNDSIILPFYREEYSEAGDSYFWVKLPEIFSGVDTEFSNYYNCSLGDFENISGTWNTGYVGVYDMRDNDEVYDLSGFDHNGTKAGNPQDYTGHIDGAVAFDGTGDWYVIDDHSDFEFGGTGNFTLEFWVNGDSWYRDRIIGKDSYDGGATYIGYFCTVYNDDKMNCVTRDNAIGSYSIKDSSILLDDTWYNFVFRRTDNELELFKNSNSLGTTTEITPIDVSSIADFYIGKIDIASSEPITGRLDMIKVSEVSRSDSWIKASYYSEIDNLLTFAPEDEQPITTTTITTTTIPFQFDWENDWNVNFWVYGCLALAFMILFWKLNE